MKKQFLFLITVFVFGFTTAKAQSNDGGGGFQHMTVQQRVDNVMSKLGDLKLDAATTVKADSIFTNFYTAQQQAMQDAMQNGQVDREAMKTKRQQLADDRDAKLKAIFTDDQFTKWKNDIEPSLRPQRGMRAAQQQ